MFIALIRKRKDMEGLIFYLEGFLQFLIDKLNLFLYLIIILKHVCFSHDKEDFLFVLYDLSYSFLKLCSLYVNIEGINGKDQEVRPTQDSLKQIL